jgi:hypothetical protein
LPLTHERLAPFSHRSGKKILCMCVSFGSTAALGTALGYGHASEWYGLLRWRDVRGAWTGIIKSKPHASSFSADRARGALQPFGRQLEHELRTILLPGAGAFYRSLNPVCAAKSYCHPAGTAGNCSFSRTQFNSDISLLRSACPTSANVFSVVRSLLPFQ